MTISFVSIHVATNDMISFFLMAEEYSILYMYHIVFIHSCVDGHLGCFRVLGMVNSAEVNAGVPGSFRPMFFSRCVPRDRTAVSYRNPTYPF